MLRCPPALYGRKEITMHYLHKILVYVPSAIEISNNTSSEDILEAVKSYARSVTECFEERVYGWREELSAGGWAKQYPQQAYLASENLEWFISELDEVLRFQEGEVASSLIRLGEEVGTELTSIVQGLWTSDDRDPFTNPNSKYSRRTAYYFLKMAEMLYGSYRCDSYFYNTHENTARLFNSDLNKIKAHPEHWALVMFDYCS